MPRRQAMYNAIQRIQESTENTLSMLKMDRFLADSNWEMTKITVLMEDPYKTPGDTVPWRRKAPNTLQGEGPGFYPHVNRSVVEWCLIYECVCVCASGGNGGVQPDVQDDHVS